jgi:hypothetical protein
MFRVSRALLDDPRVSPLKAVAAGNTTAVLHHRSRQRLLVSFRLTGAWPGPVRRCEPYELHVMEGMPHGFMQMSALTGAAPQCA